MKKDTFLRLEDLFSKYGELDDVWIARQPPGFAFVTFRSERDANEAVKELDGYKFQGERNRCLESCFHLSVARILRLFYAKLNLR